jgi:hypothetical protein
MKSAIPLLLTRPLETLATLWQALSALFFKSNEPIRPGHRYPHKPKRKNEFYPCYRVQEKIFRPLFGFYDDLAQACAK